MKVLIILNRAVRFSALADKAHTHPQLDVIAKSFYFGVGHLIKRDNLLLGISEYLEYHIAGDLPKERNQMVMSRMNETAGGCNIVSLIVLILHTSHLFSLADV